MKLSYTHRAKDDIEIAVLWYEKKRDGLGLEFFERIKECEKLIELNPRAYQKSYSVFRRCVLKRFPFSIFYTIENNDNIIVHSVFDNRQNPIKRP